MSADYAADCDRALRGLSVDGPDSAELHVGNRSVRELAAEFGTPGYFYDAGAFDRRVAAVRTALGPRVELLFSIKSNPLVAVAERLRQRGVGAEVASLGELHVALAAGHAAAELRFAGPGKTAAEVDAAVELGLGYFHVESLDEIELVAAAAARHDREVGVAVRVNLPHELQGSRMRMSGKSSRFGIDEDQVPVALRAIVDAPRLSARGLHVYAGTQGFEAESFVAHARLLTDRAATWERDLGVPLDEIDLGGGFGIATYAGDPEFDLAAAGRGVQEILAVHDRPGRRWFVELGRYLVAPAGVYVARVVRTKRSGDRQHVVIDGGMHHCAVAAGLGAVLRRPPLLVHATDVRGTDGNGSGRELVTIGGPLCTPADEFGKAVELPKLQAGDLIAVLHAGAYGSSYSPTGFLSHPTPVEVLVDGDATTIARQRGVATDVLRGQGGGLPQ